MSPTDRNLSGPDILILHVSDGSTVGETIAGRFRGDSFNLQVELCPLNKTLMLHSGSTQLLSPLRPLVNLPGSVPVHLNHEIVKSIHRMQDWPSPSSPSSSSISSSSPTWSVSKQQSPILSSALPAPCQEFNLPTEPMAKMMKTQSTEREPLANVRCGQQRTLSVLLVTPGMLKHLNTISEASRDILIELLKGGPNPVALQCFVSESELENHLEKAFGNSAFRWRHLEVGESRESFQSCMIGLMAFLEEERDMMPIPSLKRCFLFPEKPVLPGDPLYILLDSRLPESVDTSALELRISGFNDAMIARRVSELLFEFQAPECTEKSLILDVFSLDGEFIGMDTIHYIDKIQLLTSLLLQEENPARLVCQLFPAQLVSRDQLDVAFSDWLNTIQTAYCKVPGESEESYSDLPENYVRPDNLLPSELSLYLEKLQISDSFETAHRRTSSSSCPEMRKKHSLHTEVRDRCSSYPLSTERSTYENQGEEVYTTTTCCSLCRADRKGHSLLTQSRKNVCCERYGASLEEYSYCRPLPEMYPNAQHKLDYVQENCSHDASETQVQRRFGVERRNDRYREEIRTRRTQHVYETLESLSHCPPPLPPPRQQASPKYDRDLITSNGKQEKSSQRQHELRTVAGTSESSGSNDKVPGNKILNLKPHETFNKTVLSDSPKTKSQPRVGKLSIPASLQLLKSSLQSRNEPKNLAKRDARNPASHTENSSQSSRNLEQARIVYAYKPPPPLPTGGRSKSYSESYSQKECDALNMMKSRSYSTGATPTERDALFAPPTSTDSPAYKAGASNDHRDDDLKAEYSLPITFDFDFIRNDDVVANENGDFRPEKNNS